MTTVTKTSLCWLKPDNEDHVTAIDPSSIINYYIGRSEALKNLKILKNFKKKLSVGQEVPGLEG
jgi:hypothetical protein